MRPLRNALCPLVFPSSGQPGRFRSVGDMCRPPRRVQRNCIHNPGRAQAENPRIQVRVFQRRPPGRARIGQPPREPPEGPQDNVALAGSRDRSVTDAPHVLKPALYPFLGKGIKSP